MGRSGICHLICCCTVIAGAAVAPAADFYTEVVDQMNRMYGGLGGLKENGTFLNPLRVGQLRVFKREGGTLIPMQRNPNDFRTAELQADPLSWVAPPNLPAVRAELVREQRMGPGKVDFCRENTNERRLDGILQSLARILDIDIASKNTSGFKLAVTWDDMVLEEFVPNFLTRVTEDLRRQGQDPYQYFRGVDSTHESWMVTKTLTLTGLTVKVASGNPSNHVDLHFRNIVSFGRTHSTDGAFCFEFGSPVTVASSAVNVSRGNIYKYAGLPMPQR